MRALIGIFIGLVLCGSTLAEDSVNKALRLSYMISSGNYAGSAIMVTRKRDKDNIHFLWTAGHVVAHNQLVRRGAPNKFEILYNDINVIQDIVQNGRKVGAQMYHAEIIRLGSTRFGEDLALLQLRVKNLTEETTLFENGIPTVGQRVFHIGSIYGPAGFNSHSEGSIAGIGRIRRQNELFDQTSIIATSGSSGCGIYLPDGRCLGVVIEQQVPNVIFYKPVRKMREWAQKHECLWALDERVPLPSDMDILAKREKYIADIPGELAIPLRQFLSPLGLTEGK